MSGAATRMPAREAARVAASFIARIADVCERVEIAGSLRRRASTVGDIEIVAVPQMDQVKGVDMFGEVVATHAVDRLGERIDSLIGDGIVAKRPLADGTFRYGGRHKRLTFDSAPIDLFICDRERWGVIFCIRTGPYQYSHQLVTERGKVVKVGTAPDGRPLTRIGLLPAHLRCQGGWLCSRVSGQRIVTPEEADFYEAIGLPYVEPWERR